MLFLLVMAAVFQAVFSWATPLMDLIDAATSATGEWVRALLPDGALASLLVDGVIAGVGGVIVFLPQIMILFAFIIFLEDSGYMPRVAFMVDRLMRSVGLSGQSFIPMLSSFACAVPGIMATRVIPDRRDRLATILAAPFMTCSARLPVYALLIGAFVPDAALPRRAVNLQGLILLALYMLGILGGVLTALLLKRTVLRGPTPTFMIELPPYRLPSWRSMLLKLLERGRDLPRAGRHGDLLGGDPRLGAGLFPAARRDRRHATPRSAKPSRPARCRPANATQRLAALDRGGSQAPTWSRAGSGASVSSWRPAFAPLGWDWKVSAAVIASFPAREIVVASLGTIYAVGDQGDNLEGALRERLQTATRPDGSLVYTVPMAVGLLIFYVFCLQCAATIAVIRRETNSWRWPVFAWVYMTGLGLPGRAAGLPAGQLSGSTTMPDIQEITRPRDRGAGRRAAVVAALGPPACRRHARREVRRLRRLCRGRTAAEGSHRAFLPPPEPGARH